MKLAGMLEPKNRKKIEETYTTKQEQEQVSEVG